MINLYTFMLTMVLLWLTASNTMCTPARVGPTSVTYFDVNGISRIRMQHNTYTWQRCLQFNIISNLCVYFYCFQRHHFDKFVPTTFCCCCYWSNTEDKYIQNECDFYQLLGFYCFFTLVFSNKYEAFQRDSICLIALYCIIVSVVSRCFRLIVHLTLPEVLLS